MDEVRHPVRSCFRQFAVIPACRAGRCHDAGGNLDFSAWSR